MVVYAFNPRQRQTELSEFQDSPSYKAGLCIKGKRKKKKKKNRLTFTSGTQYKNIPTYSNPAGNCLPLLSPPIATDLVSVQTPTHPV